MKIEFKTRTRSYEDEECHIVLVNGKTRLLQWEGIEPEDVRFYRDLESPHGCENIIKEVIEAVKAGEEIEIIHSDEEDND
jgi:hypothetical protein